MEKVNALSLRQSLGKVLRQLQKGGQPVLVEKDRKPAAVLISLADYQKRFVDRIADEQRLEIVRRIKAMAASGAEDSVEMIRKMREGVS
jgi:prevent-host-death family protein